MKAYKRVVPLSQLILLVSANIATAQGTFQNLNFEGAKIIPDTSSPYYPNAINASNALPGWTVTGSVTAPDVFYNDLSLGAPAVSLQDTNSGFSIPQGTYCVLLQGSTAGAPGGVSIGQTGRIPSSAQSLIFWGEANLNVVSFDSQTLSLMVIGITPNYNIYGADISSFAGQTGQLLFSTPANTGALIDNIQFSVNPIPEPGTCALILCGAAVFGVTRWRKRYASSKFKVQSLNCLVATWALLFGFSTSGHAQGVFQNLNFESANIRQTQAPGFVNLTDALPGWTVYFGTDQPTQVGYNLVDAGSTWVTLLGTNGSGTIYNSLEGNFSVLLQGGLTATDASIGQTALVPLLTESIQFKAQPGFGTLTVSLGGQTIPLVSLGTGTDYTVYGGDVSAYAGQTATLEFSALNAQSVGRNDWNIDSIIFSTSPVPEPGTCALILCGAAVFGVTRWRKRYASSKFNV